MNKVLSITIVSLICALTILAVNGKWPTSNVSAVIVPGCPPTVSFGQTLDGCSIGTAAEVDTFTFNASTGDVVRINAQAETTTGDLLAQVEVRNPDGSATDCEGVGFPPSVKNVECNIASSGRHTALVKDFRGDNTGDYDISLACITPPCAPEPTPGPGPAIVSQLGACLAVVNVAYGRDNAADRWLAFQPGVPRPLQTLTEFVHSRGYFVNVSADCTINFGENVINLYTGWNLFG